MLQELDLFEQIARRRQTIKVIAESELPCSDDREVVDRLVALAGWAPFHKICSPDHRTGTLSGIEPWRFHCLDAEQCRTLRSLVANDPAAGKIPGMLASARATILSTWLPNPSSEPPRDSEAFEPSLGNVEHIAAASAAVQSLLLAATAAGINNYWSSGGVLRKPENFARLGIPANERLLGAVFLFPNALPPGFIGEIVNSKLRSDRCPSSKWSRWIKLDR
jgi:nitroreductase